MTSKLLSQLRGGSKRSGVEQLTQREREILAWLSRGVSNKEIARSLDLAESTIKVHVQNILRKLNLNGRVQAALFAVEHGLDKLP
jgi:two-component system nitrate/nitrite response regulator NarL